MYVCLSVCMNVFPFVCLSLVFIIIIKLPNDGIKRWGLKDAIHLLGNYMRSYDLLVYLMFLKFDKQFQILHHISN